MFSLDKSLIFAVLIIVILANLTTIALTVIQIGFVSLEKFPLTLFLFEGEHRRTNELETQFDFTGSFSFTETDFSSTKSLWSSFRRFMVEIFRPKKHFWSSLRWLVKQFQTIEWIKRKKPESSLIFSLFFVVEEIHQFIVDFFSCSLSLSIFINSNKTD